MRVKIGRVILLDYMVRIGTGQVVESSAGKAPIEYLHGAGQILPALERALEGLREGEQPRSASRRRMRTASARTTTSSRCRGPCFPAT